MSQTKTGEISDVDVSAVIGLLLKLEEDFPRSSMRLPTVLMYLGQAYRHNRLVPQVDLASALKMSGSTSSKVLGLLLDAAWITLEPTPEDRRINYVLLTPKGRSKLETLGLL